SRETAILSKMIGFETVVLDDRPEFANRERFPEADEIRILSSFDCALDGLVIDGKGYIVILTRGHLHDKTVLGLALRKPARYIGMIGSRKKRDAIYRALEREGFSNDDLARVHSPIGLSIGAQTPAEIAVSIAAELIRVRRER
ncbi:MAG: XdhC family protein, partial [Desulfatirhabdiaceae bacterium]